MSRHKHSLNFVVTRVFKKILCTGSKQIVEESHKYFVFLPVSHRIDIRPARFLDRFSTSENSLCNVFHDQARRHMSELSVKFDITEVSSWHTLRSVIRASFLARDSIYAIARSLLTPVRPSVRPSVCLSVPLSVTRVDQSKTVTAIYI